MKLVVLVLLSVLVLVSGDWLQDVYNAKIAAAKSKQEKLGKLPRRLLSQRAEDLSEVVETELGPVQGIIASTFRDKTPFAAYLAIPYGAPPVGDLRFKAPLPAEPWEGTLDATKEGKMCLGLLPTGLHNGEDCLNLNVYTPVLNPSNNTEPRAVMVFIYGGAYLLGSDEVNIYGPDHLLEKDVVVVAINYRIGPLGFLSLQNADVPGNAGLKDQILALKFIKNNIAKFGGDPNRVVLFGESAGSSSTSYLHLTKAAAGLFNGIILESGTALSKWARVDPGQSLHHARGLGNLVGCASGTDEQLATCLRETSALLLSELGELALTLGELERLDLFTFAPTIEPDVEGAIITREPLAILEAGDYNDVNVILGLNSQEGILISPIFLFDPTGIITEIICSDLTRFFPPDLAPGISDENGKEIAKRIKDFYFNGTIVTPSKRNNLLTLVTDSFFTLSIERYALALAKKSKANVYNYHFVYEGPFNVLRKLFLIGDDTPGVCHGDEIGYVFTDILLEELEYNNYARNSTPHITIDRFTTLWTNFAKTGNPTPTTDDTVITTTWSPLTTTQHNYLEISEQLNVKQGLAGERQKFWNDAYELAQGIRPFPE